VKAKSLTVGDLSGGNIGQKSAEVIVGVELTTPKDWTWIAFTWNWEWWRIKD